MAVVLHIYHLSLVVRTGDSLRDTLLNKLDIHSTKEETITVFDAIEIQEV